MRVNKFGIAGAAFAAGAVTTQIANGTAHDFPRFGTPIADTLTAIVLIAWGAFYFGIDKRARGRSSSGE